MLTLTPAYGRDYRSKAALLADFKDDKDFIVNDVMSRWDGKAVNRPQIIGETVKIRYNRLRSVMTLEVR